jgi:sec-independent protein translocase protein TatA
LGPTEWVLLGAIALLLFGPGLFVRAASSLGHGVREFRKGMQEGSEEREEEKKDEQDGEERPSGQDRA